MIRNHLPRLLMLIIIILLSARSAAGDDTVYLRGGSTLQGSVTQLSDAGVQIDGDGWTETIGWDRIRRITGKYAQEAEKYAVIADTLWRARIRLERGDPYMASPLFESLYDRYRGTTSVTALVICEGVLRCRLFLDENPGNALEPYLQTLRLIDLGIEQTAYNDLDPVIDPQTGLVPRLPPFRLYHDNKTIKVDLTRLPRGDDPVVDALAELYLSVFSGSDTPYPRPLPDISFPEATSVEIIHSILSASSSSNSVRRQARKELETMINSDPPAWLISWCRFAMGISLLQESSEEDRLRGVLELLRLPVTLNDAQPDLAAAAGHLAADELESQGYSSYAERIRRDLAEQGESDR